MASISGLDRAGLQGAQADIARLARTISLNYTADGADEASAGEAAGGFEDALLKAMDDVAASQSSSTDIIRQMSVDPDSVDAQDVTVAMAEANMSLNLAKTILSRIVTAWKEVINIR